MIAYENEAEKTTPVTVHVITRAQVTARLKSGRWTL